MNKRWVSGLAILWIFLLAGTAHSLKILRGRDFYDYVEVRKARIIAPPGKSVHWVMVWNHRRFGAVIFDIPSEGGCYDATVKFEPQPNFYWGKGGWRLFMKRKVYIKVVVDNPGDQEGECTVVIPCWSYDGRYRDVVPLKIILLKKES
jgi:hypothetical protein